MLTRSTSDNNLNFDPDIDLTIRALRREQRQRRENQPNLNNMTQPERRTLGDFAMPDISGSFGGIVAPAIANNNFEIKPRSFKWCKIINLEAYKEKILMLTY